MSNLLTVPVEDLARAAMNNAWALQDTDRSDHEKIMDRIVGFADLIIALRRFGYCAATREWTC